jgi:hypothetical protein
LHSLSDILNILNFVYRISCCPHADLILLKLSAPHKRLSRLALERNACVVCHKCRVSRHAQLCIDAANVITLLGPVEEFTAKGSPDSVYLANPLQTTVAAFTNPLNVTRLADALVWLQIFHVHDRMELYHEKWAVQMGDSPPPPPGLFYLMLVFHLSFRTPSGLFPRPNKVRVINGVTSVALPDVLIIGVTNMKCSNLYLSKTHVRYSVCVFQNERVDVQWLHCHIRKQLQETSVYREMLFVTDCKLCTP